MTDKAANSVVVAPWREWPKIEATWRSLELASTNVSFFLGTEWVATWLEVYGPVLQPEIAVVYAAKEAVGACILTSRIEYVRFLPLRRVYLNCAGEDEEDSTCIEHNSWLARPGHEVDTAAALVQEVNRRHWDQYLACGITGNVALFTPPRSRPTREIRPDYYVDLAAIRTQTAAYLNALSANTRSQIRRALKLYEQSAGQPASIAEAKSEPEALLMLDQLAVLHQASWTARGKPGVFQSPLFMRFHRELIQRTFRLNNIRLFRVAAGSSDIGLLYNFLFRGRVYFYQSGFQYTADNKMKPGLVSHYIAIQHCLEDPALQEYDFLAGDAQYKQSLSTNSREMCWLSCDRLTPRTIALRGLRRAKQFYERSRK